MRYSDAAQVYTWGNLLPLPDNAKQPVPRGFTGQNGRDVEPSDAASWAQRTGNLALRLPVGVIGIDVDTYDDKDGAATLEQLEAQLGELPATISSTGRGDPTVSGIRFFRRNGTGRLRGNAGPDIDVIQSGHRYAVVWPSVVSDTKGVREYKWYDENGAPMSLPPLLEDLAQLPDAWEAHLSSGASAATAAPAAPDVAEAFRADMASDGRDACAEVVATLKTWDNKFSTVARGSHHDTMLAAVHALTQSCAKGHPGYSEGIEHLADLWDAAALGADREGEFWSMVSTAVAKAATKHGGTYRPLEGDGHACEPGTKNVPEAIIQGTGYAMDELEAKGDDDSWKDRLQNEPGKLVLAKSYHNTALIMENDPVLRYLGTDTMSGRMAWRKMPPWRRNSSDRSKHVEVKVTNADLARCAAQLRKYFGGTHNGLSADAVNDSLIMYAAQNSFSPWHDFVESLPAWDGVERIPECIPTVSHTDMTRQMFLNFFLGMMSRVYEPGAQVDSMLVLVSGQGVYKTTWFRNLAPDGYYAELDTIPDGSSKGKDEMIKAHGSAIVIFDEIDKLRRKDEQAALKAFLTQRVDTWREPYGRVAESHARQFVIGGTSNDRQFLLDTTGNRRYWVVEIDDTIPETHQSRQYMALLLAEARDRYKSGERLVYDAAFEEAAERDRASHVYDPIGEAVESWLLDPVDSSGVLGIGGRRPIVNTSRVSVNMLHKHVPELQGLDLMRSKIEYTKIADAMDRHPDYEKMTGASQYKVDGKSVKRAWQRKP